ncbi:hypothetical protein ACLGIH_22380 [Streptomyces sp. HMX87]|uniref:hypothetical protein n=1 Tax=Streptomyces sp. HMX87 TaxID=3390849 RepID=UPI003A84B80F
MRLPARRTATSVLCATLLLGVTGPAAMAAEGDAARERTHTAVRAPLPDADELNTQVETLSTMGGYLQPVTELLGTVLKKNDGRLTPHERDQLTAAIEEALAKAEAPKSPAATDPDDDDDGDDDDDDDDEDWDDDDDEDCDDDDDGDWDGGGWVKEPGANTPARPPADGASDATAPNGTAPATLPAWISPTQDDPAAASAADAITIAMAALQAEVDALVKASTSGTVEQIGSAASDVVKGLLDAVAATLAGGELPAPTVADPA